MRFFARLFRGPQPAASDPAGDLFVAEAVVVDPDVATVQVKDDLAALLADKVGLQKSVDGLLSFDVYAYALGCDPWPPIDPANHEAELSAANPACD